MTAMAQNVTTSTLSLDRETDRYLAGLMTRGIATSFLVLGVGAVVFQLDQYVADKYYNGKNVLRRLGEAAQRDVVHPSIFYALMEESRQKAKMHHELMQPQIVRSIYPEYLASPVPVPVPALP